MNDQNTAAPVSYSTAEAAKHLRVAPRTVSKWFDAGRLKGFREAGTQNRRMTRADLDAFCRENEFPATPSADASTWGCVQPHPAIDARMSLTRHSELEANLDGSFPYRGFSVAPKVIGSDASAVLVTDNATRDREPVYFPSWPKARAWIDARRDG